MNFATYDPTPSMQLGLTACLTVGWSSTTNIICLPAAAAGIQLAQVLTIDTLVGTLVGTFSFDAPVVSFDSPTNLPTCEGSSLTLSGLNFGVVNSNPTAFIGDDACSTTVWLTSTAVGCRNAAGTGTGYSIGLLLASSAATIFLAFSFDSPALTAVLPRNAPTTDGATVTLVGMNFGHSMITPTLSIGLSLCNTVSWSTSSSVACSVALGSGSGNDGVIVVQNVLGSFSASFTYDSPAMTRSEVRNSPPTSGASITLAGVNFGYLDLTPSARIGSTACQTTLWTTRTQVLCSPPIGAGKTRVSAITLSGLIGCISGSFTYDAPALTYMVQYNGPLSVGGFLTLQGMNFGGSNLSPTVTLNYLGIVRLDCAQTQWVTATAATCVLPTSLYDGTAANTAILATGKRKTVIFTNDGISGTMTEVFSFDAPVLTALSNPPNAPTTSGASLTINGMNFHATDLSLTARVGNKGGSTDTSVCRSSSWVSATTVLCSPPTSDNYIPSSSSDQREVSVEINTMRGTLPQSFTYDAPIVTVLNLVNAPTTGGGSLTLLGENFAPFNGSPTISLENTRCLSTSWISDTAVLCSTPLGALPSVGVQLTVTTLVFSAPFSFTYDSPVLTSLQRWNGPVSGSTTSTVLGLNFAGTDRSPLVAIGVTSCRTAGWTSATSLACVTPAEITQGTGFDATVTVTESIGTLSAVFTFDNPLLTALSTFNAPGTGGLSLTLSGINFGMLDVSNTLVLGATVCTTTSWRSDSSVACLFARVGTGTSLSVVATVGSLSGTLIGMFTYESAVVI